MYLHYVAAFAALWIAAVAAGQTPSSSALTGPADPIAHKQVQVDVREAPYNATGDGTTDDTTAFTSAVAALNAAGGGTLHIPKGVYSLNSATLAAMGSHSIAITADNVTIRGDGADQTKIQLAGTGECGFLLGRNVDNFCIQDVTFYGNGCHTAGNSNITGSFVWWDNSGATADHHGFQIERCQVENCKANVWIYAVCYEGHDMSDVRIRDNRFISSPGNMVSTETGVASTAVRLYAPRGKPNWLRNYEISGNLCEGRYIRSFFDAHYQVQRGSVHDNDIRDVGADMAMKERQCYGISFYGNADAYADAYANRILHPYSCGIYTVTSNHLTFTDNTIVGQTDDDDSRLLKGGYAIANAADVTIRGGKVEDCVIGIQIQPAHDNAQILVDGVEVKNCSNERAFHIRPIGTPQHCGGVTVNNCRLENTNLVIDRSTNLFVDKVTLSNNIIRNGHIRWTKPSNDCVVSGNQVYTTGPRSCALSIDGGDNFRIVNNQFHGPGPRVQGSCAIYLGSILTNPSAITGNTISGFQYGLHGAHAACTVKDNTFVNVEDAAG